MGSNLSFFLLKIGNNYKRFLASFGVSLLFSFTLGLSFLFWSILSPEANSNTTITQNLSGLKNTSLGQLWNMGFIPIALGVSLWGAILISPLAFWTFRTGKRNLVVYGSVLWVLLALFIIFGLPSFLPTPGGNRLVGVFLLGVLGLVVIGLIPPKRTENKDR